MFGFTLDDKNHAQISVNMILGKYSHVWLYIEELILSPKLINLKKLQVIFTVDKIILY